MRAIERNADALTAAAGDELDGLLRERDETGVGAKYLAAVAEENCASAFMAILRDPMTAALRLSRERAFDSRYRRGLDTADEGTT